MNRPLQIALTVIMLNMVLMMLFPPYDYVSLQRGNVPTFDGFYLVFGSHANRVINQHFLTLEILVALINACIAWLLMRPKPVNAKVGNVNRYQRGLLWVVAINLMLVVLFPPFQNYAAITKATLPSFEGFYFLFGDNSQRQLVVSILYMEVVLILINGCLLWLILKSRSREKLSAEDVRRLAGQLRSSRKP